jgi:hypothetical protein
MKRTRSMLCLALAAVAILSFGCTVFTDDLYKLQSGQYGSNYASVDRAIYDEFAERFSDGRVYRANVESNFDHWTAVSAQWAMGHDRYRVRVTAYPNLDGDGQYEPVVIARQEIYAGQSYGARGRPSANYSNKWMEVGRDVDLEAAVANGVYNRMRTAAAGGQ